MKKVTYSYVRQHLSTVLDHIVDDAQIVCIERKNGKKVVMLEESDFNSLAETAYLIKSQKNAKELFKALEEAKQNLGEKVEF